MEDSIVERVIVLMEQYGLSASAFADKIDVQRSSMSHLVSGRNKPSLDFIQKVLNNFSDINPTWLIMGTGPMKQLDLFDIKGDVAPVEPIPAENFRTDAPTAEQTVIKQSFQAIEAPQEAPKVVYAQAAPTYTHTPEPNVAQPQVVYKEEPVIAAPVYIAPAPAPAPVQHVVAPAPVQHIAAPSPSIQEPAAQITSPPTTQAPSAEISAAKVVQDTIQSEKSAPNDKKVVKIVFFYSDNTFETFNPQ